MTITLTRLLFCSSILSALFFSNQAQSQEWVQLWQSGANYWEVKASFDAYWEGKEIERGKGYNQFMRWANFIEPRIGADGNTNINAKYWEAYQKLNASEVRANTSGARSTATWQPVAVQDLVYQSYNPGIGRINTVRVDPNDPNTYYIGSPAGGIWKTENDGLTWTNLNDNMPTLGVSGIAIDPNNTNVIYIGTGDRDASDSYSVGLWKSTNGGETFVPTGLNFLLSENVKCSEVLIDPNDSNKLFVATNEGVYRSANAGESWLKIASGDIKDIEFHPTNSDIIYACSNLFLRSTNGGDSFAVNFAVGAGATVIRSSIGVSIDEPDWVYVLQAGDDSGMRGIYKSENAGENFSLVYDELNLLGYGDGFDEGGQGWYDLALEVNPDDANDLVTGGVNVWRSLDGAESFDKMSWWAYDGGSTDQYTHADIHMLRAHGDRLFVCSDGGIFVSEDFGSTWSNRTEGINNTQYYDIAVFEDNQDRILGGTQDNGTILAENGTWTHILGADGMEAKFHPNDENVVYASSQYGGLRRSDNGGLDFQGIRDQIDQDGAWVTPYLVGPVNGNHLYAGFEDVWRSTDRGNNWTALSNFAGGSPINELAVARADQNYIYFSRDGIFYRTTNGGADWDLATDGLPGNRITEIVVDEDNEETVWVTISTFEPGEQLYKTTNAGENWEAVVGGLPAVPAVCLSRLDNGEMYIGTDLGVFYTNDDLVNWSPFNQGMPTVQIRDLEINEDANTITAATYGRGLWRSALYVDAGDLPTAKFDVDRKKICEGQSVSFTDLSWDSYAEGRTWAFEGGTPASSNAQYPQVTYETPGTYSVSLEVANINGTDTETIIQWIEVYATAAQEEVLVEGFEAYDVLSDGAFDLSNTIDNQGFELTDAAALGGTNSLFVDNASMNEKGVFSVSSRPYDLSMVNEEFVFSLDLAYVQMEETNEDRLRLFFSADCGATWELEEVWLASGSLASAAQQVAAFYPQAETDWAQFDIALAAQYRTEGFRYKFEFENDNGNNLFIDNIRVDMPDGIEDLTKTQTLVLFPNPTQSEVNLQLDGSAIKGIATIEVSDLQGRSIQVTQTADFTQSGQHSFSVQDLPQGLYTVTVRADAANWTRTFVKQ